MRLKGKTLYAFGMVLILGIILGQVIKSNICFYSTVIGDSMQPTYKDGDIVCVNRLKSVSRGDVIAIDETEEDKWIIKRVIAIPGDTIQIVDSTVYINEVKYEEDYLYSTDAYNSGLAENEIVLGEDEYFVMGDNRQVSKDSRIIGVINANKILGVVVN